VAARWCFALVEGAAVLALPAVARAADPMAPVIWYRSSEGCPDGAAFVARLSGRAPGARIAEVNDRIDFVVTVGRNGAMSSGRLERQTAGSTVAIREIEAESCEEVADVLAFSLSLALTPAAEATPSVPPTAPSRDEAPPAQSATPSAPAVSRPASNNASPRFDQPAADPATKAPDARWALGLDVGALTGPLGALGPWLGAFGERRLGIRSLPGSSARLTALFSRVEDSQAELVFGTAAGRLEGCPVAVGGHELAVSPCLGFELGFASAEGLSATGRDDSGIWVAGNLLGRLSWRTAPSLVLAVEFGATAPFVRYSFVSESGSSVYLADSIGFFAAFGGAMVLP